MNYLFMFFIKLFDQVLRTQYLLELNDDEDIRASLLVGLQQLVFIYITVSIVNDYSFINCSVLVSSTMLGTYLTMKAKRKKKQKLKELEERTESNEQTL